MRDSDNTKILNALMYDHVHSAKKTASIRTAFWSLVVMCSIMFQILNV